MTKELKNKRNKLIANEALSGKSQKEISQHHGISRSQVSRILDRDEIKETLRKGMADQIRLVPKATQVLEDCLSDDDPKIRLSSAVTVFKNVGIAPSHGPNIQIQTLIQQDNRSSEAEQMDALKEFMAWKHRSTLTDVTPDPDNPANKEKEDSTDDGDKEGT